MSLVAHYANFLNIPKEYSSLSKSKVVIIPFPYEATTSYRTGTKEGPAAIIAASAQIEAYDNELHAHTYEVGIATVKEVELDRTTYQKPLKQLKSMVSKVLKNDQFPITLGGEHTLSVGAVEAMVEKYPDLVVLDFDAHADLRDEFEGTRYSHACGMRRISDLCPLVQLFMRNVSQGEWEFIKTSGKTKIFWDQDYHSGKWNVKDVLNALGDRPVYISFDVDCFSPGVIPGTGTPEPGGPDWYQVLDILREVFRTRNVVGADVVELLPLGGQVISEFTAAKLVYKMIGYKYFLKK